METLACSAENFAKSEVSMRFETRILRKTCIKLIDGSGKGAGSPKTEQKVLMLEGEKGYSKNSFSKGISNPKTGLKRAKGLSGPTLTMFDAAPS